MPVSADGKYTGPGNILTVATNADPNKKVGRGVPGPDREARLQAQHAARAAQHGADRASATGRTRRSPICPTVGWFKDFSRPAVDARPDVQRREHPRDGQRRTGRSSTCPAINRAMDKAATLRDRARRATRRGPRSTGWSWSRRPALPFMWDKTAIVYSKDVQGVISDYLTGIDFAYTLVEVGGIRTPRRSSRGVRPPPTARHHHAALHHPPPAVDGRAAADHQLPDLPHLLHAALGRPGGAARRPPADARAGGHDPRDARPRQAVVRRSTGSTSSSLVFHFDFGYSYQTNESVKEQIFDRLPATISLAVGAHARLAGRRPADRHLRRAARRDLGRQGGHDASRSSPSRRPSTGSASSRCTSSPTTSARIPLFPGRAPTRRAATSSRTRDGGPVADPALVRARRRRSRRSTRASCAAT